MLGQRRWFTVRRVTVVAGVAFALGCWMSGSSSAGEPAGTAVCGSLPFGETTWSATGAPYRICPTGLEVPSGSTLILDGADGGFDVQAQGLGGITLTLGSMKTVNTSPAAQVVFDSASSSALGSWTGLTGVYGRDTETYSCPSVYGGFALSYVQIRHAVRGLDATGRDRYCEALSDPLQDPNHFVLRLDHLTISDTSQDGMRITSLDSEITDSVFARTGATGLLLDCSVTHISSEAAVRRVAVTASAGSGIRSQNCRARLVDNVVTGSGKVGRPSAAILLTREDGSLGLGEADGIVGNSGSGNAMDAIAVEGRQDGSVVWITPVNAPAVHPLGYVNLGLTLGPAAVFPPGSVVKSGRVDTGYTTTSGLLSVQGDVVIPDSVLSSLADDTVGPPTCGLVSAGTCTPTTNDWTGLRTLGVVTLSRDRIRYADVALRNRDLGYTALPRTTTVITDSTVEQVGSGLQVNDLTIQNTSFTDIVPSAPQNSWAPTGALYVTGDLEIDDVSVSHVQGVALDAGPRTPADDTADIDGFVVDGANAPTPVAARYGTVDNSSTRAGSFRHIRVTNSGRPGYPSNAVALVADHLTVGLGQRVDDITGSGNSRDSVCIAGFVESDFVWTSAKRNTAPDQALGYYGCSPTIVDATFTIPGGADAYVGGISLQGAALDATAGDIAIHASTITSTDSASRPSAVDLRGVRWTPFDPSTNNWIRMSLTSASGEGTFNATDSSFTAGRYQLGVPSEGRITSRHVPVVLTRTTLDRVGIDMQDAALRLSDSTIRDLRDWAVQLRRADNSSIVGSLLSTTGWDAVKISDSNAVSLVRSRINQAGSHTTFHEGGPFGALAVDADSDLTGACNSVTGNAVGVLTSGSVSITDSDLYANNGTFEGGSTGTSREIVGTGAVDAQRVWWGQPGGPRPGQLSNPGQVDASQSAPTQRPAGSLTVTGTRKTDDSYANGRQTVRLALSRRADTSVQPQVVVTRPDGSSQTLAGTWIDETHWQAPLTLSGADGMYVIRATGARSCIADPATNMMSTATVSVLTTTASFFVPVTPAVAYSTGSQPLTAAADREVALAGVPAGATAVVVSAQVTSPTAASGYLRISPAGTNPHTGSVFFTKGQRTSSYTTVKVVNGKIRLHLSGGAATVTLDLAGYYTAASSSAGASRFVAATPAVAYSTGSQPLTAAADREVALAGVPAGATAVVVSAQVTSPTAASGYLRISPAGTNPHTGSVFFTKGQRTSSYTTVKVVNGKIRLHLSGGAATVTLDLAGYYTAASSSAGASRFVAATPAVAYSTGSQPLTAAADREVALAGVPAGATAVVVSAQVTSPTAASGYLRISPAGTNPHTGSVFFTKGQRTSSYTTVKVVNGKIRLHLSGGAATVTLDLAGYYTNS